jgi:hypothetical protein
MTTDNLNFSDFCSAGPGEELLFAMSARLLFPDSADICTPGAWNSMWLGSAGSSIEEVDRGPEADC